MPVAYQQNSSHWRCTTKLSVPRMCSSEPRSLISLLNAPKNSERSWPSSWKLSLFGTRPSPKTAKSLADPGCSAAVNHRNVLSLVTEIDGRKSSSDRTSLHSRVNITPLRLFSGEPPVQPIEDSTAFGASGSAPSPTRDALRCLGNSDCPRGVGILGARPVGR
jgi:hypothetical protein